ncbi:MAG: hypothetical protein M3Z05_11910 [Gemmatimonadota bacterium]|nr:hypothetical protein [Gemmatimonadota bacterium]
MSHVARVAKADLPNTPAIEPLRMPKGRLTTERLSTAANGMAKAAVPFAPVFVDAGLPSDFVAQLNAAANARCDVPWSSVAPLLSRGLEDSRIP